MSSASRRRRRRALLAGLCPVCLERPISHEVRLHGWRPLVSCVECWPELRDRLRLDGVTLRVVNGR